MRSHRHQFRVIYGDTDMMGVVYYGNYFRYFEAGRSEFLRAIDLPYSRVEEAGYALPISEAKAKYHAPAKYDDLLTLDTTLEDLKRASLRMSYRLTRDDQLIATGMTVQACLGPGGQLTRIPDLLREKLTP
ncbi:MAG: thioesterase family protein [Myxococcota bacterium]